MAILFYFVVSALNFEDNVKFISNNIIEVLSLKKSPFHILVDDELVLEFVPNVEKILNFHI